MEKKQFKAESQRLMDLMINSIYTHKEIFLREIISNASDAIDKLAYRALTDEKVGLNREDFKIVVVPDKEARTLTVADNGIGMTQEEMENNLGTIAKSGSLQFKKETENADDAELDIQYEKVEGPSLSNPDVLMTQVGDFMRFRIVEEVLFGQRTT